MQNFASKFFDFVSHVHARSSKLTLVAKRTHCKAWIFKEDCFYVCVCEWVINVSRCNVYASPLHKKLV